MGFIDNIVTAFRTQPVQERNGMPQALIPANRSTQGSTVTVGEALTLPAVYRAISILSTTAKQMSIHTVRDDLEVSSPSFIKQPNPLTSRSAFIEQTIVSLASQGNAYWLIDKDSTGKLVALTPLNPLDMTIETDDIGRVINYKYMKKDYLPQRIKHITLLQVPGSVYGLGPIQAAGQSLHGHIELRDFSSTWFEKSGVPSGVLKTDQFVTDEQVAAAKAAWNETAGAKKGVSVMGNGWSYMPVYLNPEQLQFIQSQNFSVTEVARMFGVPSTLMFTAVDGSSMVYSNVEQEWTAFMKFSMMQYLIVIEDALSEFLPGRQKAKFNTEAILRGDTRSRYESYKIGIEAGWLLKSEVRGIEDLPVVEGIDDVITQPTQPMNGDTTNV